MSRAGVKHPPTTLFRRKSAGCPVQALLGWASCHARPPVARAGSESGAPHLDFKMWEWDGHDHRCPVQTLLGRDGSPTAPPSIALALTRSVEDRTKCCYHHPQCPRTRIPLPTSSTTATTSPSSATTSPPPPSTLIYLDALQLPPGLQRPLRREGRRPLRLPDHRLQGHLGVDQKPPAPTMRRSLATPYWHLIRASIRLDPC